MLGRVLGQGSGLGSGLGSGSPSWFTRLVLQHPFRSQGRENILAASSSSKQQQASSRRKQAATELISASPRISINIDGTSPKLLGQIALVMMYKPTRFQVETHPWAGLLGKKVLKSQKSHGSPGEDRGQARPYSHRTTEPYNHRAIQGKALKVMKATTSLVLV